MIGASAMVAVVLARASTQRRMAMPRKSSSRSSRARRMLRNDSIRGFAASAWVIGSTSGSPAIAASTGARANVAAAVRAPRSSPIVKAAS